MHLYCLREVLIRVTKFALDHPLLFIYKCHSFENLFYNNKVVVRNLQIVVLPSFVLFLVCLVFFFVCHKAA